MEERKRRLAHPGWVCSIRLLGMDQSSAICQNVVCIRCHYIQYLTQFRADGNGQFFLFDKLFAIMP